MIRQPSGRLASRVSRIHTCPTQGTYSGLEYVDKYPGLSTSAVAAQGEWLIQSGLAGDDWSPTGCDGLCPRPARAHVGAGESGSNLVAVGYRCGSEVVRDRREGA